MTLLYDSDNPDSIPDGVAAAGYCDGYAALPPYDWLGRGFARFPNAIRIAVFAGTNDGHALDVEGGNAAPDEAPAWVKLAHARGITRPWVYCNRSNRPAVENALALAGISADQVALWVATLDGTQDVAPGPYPVAAVQYANSTISGGHYDLSIVNDLYGPGGSTIGVDMATLEQILAAVTLPPPPVEGTLVSQTEEQLTAIINTSSWADILRVYGQNNFKALYARAHPLGLGQAILTLQAEVLALQPGGGAQIPEPVEPKTITLKIDSVPGTATGTIS